MFRKMFYLLSLFACLNVSFSEAMFNSGPNNFKAYLNRVPQHDGNIIDEEVNFGDMRVEEESDIFNESIQVQKFQGDMNEEDKNQNSMLEEDKNQNSFENIFSEKQLYCGPQNSPINSSEKIVHNLPTTMNFTTMNTLNNLSPKKGSLPTLGSKDSVFKEDKRSSAEALSLIKKRNNGTITIDEAINLFCYLYRVYTSDKNLFSDFKIFLNKCSELLITSIYYSSNFVEVIINRLEISNDISFSNAQKENISIGLTKAVKSVLFKKTFGEEK